MSVTTATSPTNSNESAKLQTVLKYYPRGRKPTKQSNQLQMARYRCQERQCHYLHSGNKTLWRTGNHFAIFGNSGQAENLAQDMADLMHDFDAVSR